ncbi:MAG: LLM class flavin-dependent oxidoreductase [Ilumatobacter sp.]|nr:LLM class flavin-dependent oxidoreductase [Ilumatobacter sp.]
MNSGFDTFGEECDRRTRAELMDECLDIVCGLWGGQLFEYSGRHYTVQPSEVPTIEILEQSPRVPI